MYLIKTVQPGMLEGLADVYFSDERLDILLVLAKVVLLNALDCEALALLALSSLEDLALASSTY